MLKIKELLKNLVDTQKSINENLVKLNKNIEPKINTIKISADTISTFGEKLNYMETNIYTKEETIEKINTEYDYRKEYEECKEKNEHLLYIIEKYCRYENKYEVLKIFNEINKEYGIIKRG